MILKKVVTTIILFHFSNVLLCQNTSIVNYNMKVLERCDTSFVNYFINGENKRTINKSLKKVNYKKIYLKDKELVSFLNYYHDTNTSYKVIIEMIKKLKFQASIADTLNNTKKIIKGTVFNDGFVQIQIWVVYENAIWKKKYYHLSLSNTPPLYSNKLNYHRKLFRQLRFKLLHFDDCYNYFEDL